ncbi:tail fiber assembly protein [Aeromonas veronii]|uniref:tail fiber assembly protein n=1 Tax=Aeromonas veronii TaxID=654 RepID=UPI00123B5701|nr:tail fiber assembly protein [Aeromonas veronii]QET78092.1 tail fiber assembly protein [Aeromonas veronii]
MGIYFSAHEMGFFSSELYEQATMPADVKPVTQQDYLRLLDGMSQGHHLGADDQGEPMLLPPTTATTEQLAGIAKAEQSTRLREAADAIAPLLYLETTNQLSDTETMMLANWRQYTVEVSRANQQPGWPSTISWPVKPG